MEVKEMETLKTNNQIQYGDLVLLWFGEDETTYLVEVVKGKRMGIHCGKPPLMDDWVGKEFGTKVVFDHGQAYLLKPSTEDLMMKAARESGIIYPKDAAFLMIRSGIRPGFKVLEIGTGSGSLTMALATAVAPNGKVHTYDRRLDLPQNAVKNITRAGLTPYVEFHQRVAGEAIPEKDFDAAILDTPQPWEDIEVVKAALKGGGRIVTLNPTFNQIEKSAEAMRRAGFIKVESVELLERPLLAREGKTRPVQRMVSHTEFMVFGIKVLDQTAPVEPVKESV